LVAVHEKLARGLFRAMGRPELGEDPRFCSRDVRVTNAHELEAMINDWSRSLPTSTVVNKLEAEGVPVAPVRHPEDALVDPRVIARKETMPVAQPAYGSNLDLRTAGVPIHFSGARTGFDKVLPVRIGEHNADVYRDLLGYSEERIAELEAAGAI
jgi:crotonobetainyl-CoA:carnitine CoA-transferase CaiB-like acyl-CoA transferase